MPAAFSRRGDEGFAAGAAHQSKRTITRRRSEVSISDGKGPTPELYVSCDIEADGPCPGLFSMLSFGLAAFSIDKRLVGTFSRNLELLDGADVDERTSRWWQQPTQQQAYAASRDSIVSPRAAMVDAKSWLDAMRAHGKPILCGAPSGFDFTFMYYYFQRFLGESPIGFASLDLRSYAAAVMKRQYRHVGKRQYPSDWIDADLPHTHVALDDAIEQGCILVNMMRANLGLDHIASLVDERATATAVTGGSEVSRPMRYAEHDPAAGQRTRDSHGR